jgi:hypothetical protein
MPPTNLFKNFPRLLETPDGTENCDVICDIDIEPELGNAITYNASIIIMAIRNEFLIYKWTLTMANKWGIASS